MGIYLLIKCIRSNCLHCVLQSPGPFKCMIFSLFYCFLSFNLLSLSFSVRPAFIVWLEQNTLQNYQKGQQ